MTIIEALKSGKRFRRKGNMVWLSEGLKDRNSGFTVVNILADDWETEERFVTVTKQQFWGAYDKALKNIHPLMNAYGWSVVVSHLAKELGLDE